MELETEFKQKALEAFGKEGLADLERAFLFAKNAYQGKKRENGEDYICHSYNVAKILLNSAADKTTVISGFIHDLLKVTNVSEKQIEAQFGEDVRNIALRLMQVDMVKQAYYANTNEAVMQQKMLLALSKDTRMIFVKLADRLDNLRTLDVKPEHKAFSIARETMDIYVPLAERLGMNSLKSELEDMAFRYLYPDENREIEAFIETFYKKSNEAIKQIETKIVNLAREHKVACEVQSRLKSKYSIYRKWQSKGKDRVLDVIALRVITNNVKDCYAMLGAINDCFSPVEGRMKDYIANPKQNLYMSIHNTVLYDDGKMKMPFEVQIRTKQMHRYCEYGYAAHWIYKEQGIKKLAVKGSIKDLRNTLTMSTEEEDEVTPQSVINELNKEFYPNEIFVFTPNLNIIELPKGAIPIDFAYNIHSSLGNKCAMAKVNSKLVTLTTPLKTGDKVEILTSSASKGSSRDWLKLVKSKEAVYKIKQYFKKEKREENIKLGRDILEEFAKNQGYTLSRLLEDKQVINEIENKFHLTSYEDLFLIVGYGGMTASQSLGKVISKLKADEKKKLRETRKSEKENSRGGGVVVGGHKDILKRFAKCCNPIPGDEIVGFVSRGAGVTIHRSDCKALAKLPQERIIDVSWPRGEEGLYDASFKVACKNVTGVLSAVSSKIADNKVDITFISSEKTRDKEDALMVIGVKISSRKQLEEIMNKISALPYIYEVYR